MYTSCRVYSLQHMRPAARASEITLYDISIIQRVRTFTTFVRSGTFLLRSRVGHYKTVSSTDFKTKSLIFNVIRQRDRHGKRRLPVCVAKIALSIALPLWTIDGTTRIYAESAQAKSLFASSSCNATTHMHNNASVCVDDDMY